jgi:hypothetical protein
MDRKKEVINECLLVNYSRDYGDDGPCLIVSRSNEGTSDIYTFRDEKATLLYSKLLNIIGICRTNKEEN